MKSDNSVVSEKKEWTEPALTILDVEEETKGSYARSGADLGRYS